MYIAWTQSIPLSELLLGKNGRCNTMKLHMGFYIFTINCIFIYLSITKNGKKIHAIAKIRNNQFYVFSLPLHLFLAFCLSSWPKCPPLVHSILHAMLDPHICCACVYIHYRSETTYDGEPSFSFFLRFVIPYHYTLKIYSFS